MLLRSFAEHRPAADAAHRSAIVESRGPLAWLYLSNNLHALHHERPGLPWFVLPKVYRANREAVLTRNGGYRLAGYAALARRWLLHPRDHPRLPGRGRAAVRSEERRAGREVVSPCRSRWSPEH